MLRGHLTDTKTSPDLIAAIINGLDKYVQLNGGGRLSQTPEVQSDDSKQLEYCQTRIGWQHIFRGLIPLIWSNYQCEYESKDRTEKSPRDKWTPKLIRFLHRHAYRLWTERCTQVHDSEARRETEQSRRRAETMVTAMYRHENNVGATDRAFFFDIPLQERLTTHTATTLLDWQRSSQKALNKQSKTFNRSQHTTK